MQQQLACFTHFCYTWAESFEKGINSANKRYLDFTSEQP